MRSSCTWVTVLALLAVGSYAVARIFPWYITLIYVVGAAVSSFEIAVKLIAWWVKEE